MGLLRGPKSDWMGDGIRLMKCGSGIVVKYGLSFLPPALGILTFIYVAMLNRTALIVGGPIVLIYAILNAITFIVFISYLNHDFGVELRIDYKNKTLTRKSPKSVVTIEFDRITSIVVNKSPNLKGWMNPLEDYLYIELVVPNQPSLVITFLLCDDLQLGLDGITKSVTRRIPYIMRQAIEINQ